SLQPAGPDGFAHDKKPAVHDALAGLPARPVHAVAATHRHQAAGGVSHDVQSDRPAAEFPDLAGRHGRHPVPPDTLTDTEALPDANFRASRSSRISFLIASTAASMAF